MDQNRFDALTRSLSTGWSRRTALGVTLGGVLGMLSPRLDASTAKKRRCKPTCGTCEQCKKGKCRRTASGTKRCKKGRCKPKANGTVCGTGQVCQGGTCACHATSCGACATCQSDGTCAGACGGAGCCAGGICQPGTSLTACGAGGGSCATCTGEEICSGGTCVVPACGAGGPCRVFLTSTTHNGNLGGLGGADTICQGLADAAGLPGTYLAWLSDDTDSPATRFPTQSTGPYRLIDGTTIAANWTDLTDGTLAVAINMTETGGGAGGTNAVWTHTRIDGTAGGLGDLHCENWSTGVNGPQGDIGSDLSREAQWTEGLLTTCNGGLRLYCFQQS